ncbi:MAG TPA: formyltransferase family protein [Thermoanaerobaculia bacterium]|nr:formyltransferase family protein [Thermoanaerobaculia bacterium]
MRIVLFASGSPASLIAWEKLSSAAEVVAVVVPRKRRGQFRGTRILRFAPSPSFTERLARLRPDLICVATFPAVLRPEVIGTALHGAINVHPSLLPRHRGPDPIFWTYFHDDAETGVTVHRIDDGVDAGPILMQRSLPLPRLMRGLDLYRQLAAAGAELLVEAVRRIAADPTAGVPQNETAATIEPRPLPGRWSIDYDRWPAERLAHFLAGVEHRPRFTLPDRDGRRHLVGPGTGWREQRHTFPPGTIRGRTLFARDGVVHLGRPRFRDRLAHLLAGR